MAPLARLRLAGSRLSPLTVPDCLSHHAASDSAPQEEGNDERVDLRALTSHRWLSRLAAAVAPGAHGGANRLPAVHRPVRQSTRSLPFSIRGGAIRPDVLRVDALAQRADLLAPVHTPLPLTENGSPDYLGRHPRPVHVQPSVADAARGERQPVGPGLAAHVPPPDFPTRARDGHASSRRKPPVARSEAWGAGCGRCNCGENQTAGGEAR